MKGGTPTASSQRPVPGADCARRATVPGSPRQSRDIYFGTAPILQRASPQMKRRAQFRRSNGTSVRICAITQAYFSFSVPTLTLYRPIGDIGRTQNERYSPPIAAIPAAVTSTRCRAWARPRSGPPGRICVSIGTRLSTLSRRSAQAVPSRLSSSTRAMAASALRERWTFRPSTRLTRFRSM